MAERDVAIKISAQNEALRELEKARAEIVRLTDTAKRQLGQNFPAAAQASTRGIQGIKSALQTLAFQATGVSGPIGKLSTGLLAFGAGSTLVIGLTAGIAAIAGAFKLANREIAAFGQAVEDAQKLSTELVGSAHTQALARRAAAQGQLADARAALDLARRPTITAIPGPIPGVAAGQIRTAPDEALITQAATAVSAWEHALQLAEDAVTELEASLRVTTHTTTKLTDQERAMERARRDFFEERLIIQAELADRGTGVRLPILQAGGGALPDIETGEHFLKLYPEITKSTTALTRALLTMDDGLKSTANAAQATAVTMIGAFAGLVQGVLGRGGAGGFLSGLGGLVGSIKGFAAGPIVGAVLGGLGSIVGGSEGVGRVVIDGYTQRALDQQRRQEENKRNVVILQVVDAQGKVRDQIYDITRYQNRGGTAGGITARSDGGAVTTRSG